MFIRTERLFLRPTFPEDWRELHAAITDQRIARMLSRVPWPYREEDARAYCARGPAAPGDWRFAITLPGVAGAPLIGQIGLGPDPDEPEGGPELGYWVGTAWQGHGIATEAVRGVLATARALRVERVAAGHFLDNPASGRVLRKAGFAETGRVRPTPCAGRGGMLVPARRYVCELEAVSPALGEAA